MGRHKNEIDRKKFTTKLKEETIEQINKIVEIKNYTYKNTAIEVAIKYYLNEIEGDNNNDTKNNI